MKWNVIKYLLKSSESSGPSLDCHLERISGREVNRISRNVRSNLLQSESPTEKNRQNECRHIWKKVDVRKIFWKEGRLRVGILTFCGLVKYGEWRYVWRIVLCHIRWVTIFCGSFSVEVWWGMSCLFQRKVWENLWQTFSRPSKLLILEGTFDISEVFAVLLGRVLVTILYVCFRSTLVVFIFV